MWNSKRAVMTADTTVVATQPCIPAKDILRRASHEVLAISAANTPKQIVTAIYLAVLLVRR